MNKENLELAEEHIKLAEELVRKEALDEDGDKKKILSNAALALEKAETEVAESEKE